MRRFGLRGATAYVALLTGLAWVGEARANLELPALHDARSVGMGGAGVAFIESAAAAFHNTAGLGFIDTFSATAQVSPYLVSQSGPWFNPNASGVENYTTPRSVVPLGLVGAGYRIHDRVVVGLASFLSAGSGAKYDALPLFDGNGIEVEAFAAEAQVPVAIRVTDQLTIGAAYRLSYGRLSTLIPQLADENDPGQGYVVPEATLSAIDAAGYQLGVRYDPFDFLQLGFTYRSKVTMELEGDAVLDGATVATGITQPFNLPHTMTAGMAMRLLNNTLTLTGEAKYWMYSDSHPQSAQQSVAWNDVVQLSAGAEYWVRPTIPLRLGMAWGTSAIADEVADQFLPPPNQIFAFTAGTRMRFRSIDVDVGGGYAFFPEKVIAAGANPGTYSGNTVFFSLSATYRI